MSADPRPDDAMAELKPCPFCGKPAEMIRMRGARSHRVGVRCSDAFCGAANRLEFGEEEAVELWNTRHSAPAREVTGEIPREPNEAMINAGLNQSPLHTREVWPNGQPRGIRRSLDTDEIADIWRAMWDAATPAPARGREDGDQQALAAAYVDAQDCRVKNSDGDWDGYTGQQMVEAWLAGNDAALSKPVLSAEVGERAVMVCPQCEGEGGYADGLDEAACHTECTRCGSNGWIVDLERLAQGRTFEDGIKAAAKVDVRGIALAAIKEARQAGESQEMLARWISERVRRALADPDIRLESDYGQQ